MTQHHVSVNITGLGQGEITLDGQRLRRVQGVTFGARVDEMALIILEVAVPTATVEGEMVAVLPEGTAETLLALGWTPPDEQTLGGSDRPKAWRHLCGQLNEGAEAVMCGGCRFDVEGRPEAVEARYVLVEVPSDEEVDDAAPE